MEATLSAGGRATRVMEVVTARVDRDHQHPLLGNEPGGGDDRFRAVHDLIGHVRPGHGFDRRGGFDAWLAQDSPYRGLARRALASDLRAEHSVLWTAGVSAEHEATLVATHVILRVRRGLPGPKA
jgi:hypothetical protein